MAKWAEKEQERSDGEDSNDELGDATYGRQRSKWLPRTLELLFGGRKEVSGDEQKRRAHRRQAHTEEVRLMELLIDEELDEERIVDMKVM